MDREDLGRFLRSVNVTPIELVGLSVISFLLGVLLL